MMAGAGTDYAVFLISRYHDYLRLGEPSDRAVKKALASIGKVIAASAATVAVTFLGMVFTKLAVFSTVGLALSIAIGVGFLAAVTLLPAILVLVGRRGWIAPRRELTSRFWRRSGIRIVREPKVHLVASLLVLVILASCVSLVHYNYDDRKALPPAIESTLGYGVIGQHFPVNSSHPAVPPRRIAARPAHARRPSPTSNRWRTESANCPASTWSGASRDRPVSPWNKPGCPTRRARWAPSSTTPQQRDHRSQRRSRPAHERRRHRSPTRSAT